MPHHVSLLIPLVAVMFLHLSPPLPAAQPSPSADTTGATLEGTITYQPDKDRPWKFSRYYIKDRKKGLLAETVVALARSDLKQVAPKKTVVMDQVAFQFVPETIAIQAGDSVKFTNSDDAVHNVMSNDGGKPFNVNMAKNSTHTIPFNQAGGIDEPVRIGCIYHGGMRAWIYVFDHPWHTVTKQDGQFRLTHVPPGDYTLHIAHPAGRLAWAQPVKVTATGNIKLDIHLSPDNLGKTKK